MTRWIATMAAFLLSCVGSRDNEVENAPPRPSTSTIPATSAASSSRESRGNGSRRAEEPLLGENEVRASLIVIPGSATVEVDGLVWRRRNGVIELVGKVGDVRRVRAFKGSVPGEEKMVTIEGARTSPPMIDANEMKPVVVLVKKTPAKFSYED